jgi:1-acyl-sn-glycerol-3-phosphate acyltransferase
VNRERLSALRKDELMVIAREFDVAGRSTMTKAQLVDALVAAISKPEERPRTIALPGISPEDRRGARARRSLLYARLGAMVDQDRHCGWRSIEGHPCGFPVVRGAESCAIHGGGDIADVAVPVTGELGFHTWPTLSRHMFLATYDADPIGLDPLIAEMAWHLLNGLYYDYFRVEVDGIEHVPMDGPAVLVGNHGGAALPYDAAMLMLAVLNEAPIPRRVRVVGTEIFNMLPWVSHLYRKTGAAYATRDDARFLLSRGALVGVFPEGERGFMKPVWQAYHVQRFGRGGFVDLAERTGTPIVPVAIVGSEEVHPAVAVSRQLARVVQFFFPEQRVEEIAIILNPIPLPVRWHIRFLPPLFPEGLGEEIDPLRTLERAEQIRRTVQEALDDMLARRRSAF